MMTQLENLLLRTRRKRSPRRNKRGSSLAFVMIIGAALIIWSAGIMPVITSAGTTTYATQSDLTQYISNRSAVEFCKSELVYMAKTQIPGTFAVIDEGDGEYFAVYKRLNGVVDPNENGYKLYVSSPDSDDHNDVPKTTEKGKQVAAICSVKYNVLTFKYDIIISTYQQGKPGMRYTATFTPSGSLKIRPEAYDSGDALPLSDFVLVDGKLGAKTVWNSTITKSNAGTLDFRETMLSANKMENGWYYANGGEYPVLFKTTAHAANALDNEIGEELDLGALSSDEEWIEPVAVAESDTKNKGNIWYTLSGNTIQIKMQANAVVDITEDCTIYINGTPSSTLPTKIGHYTIAIDYSGTDYSADDHISKYDENEVNVLPVAGLTLGSKSVTGHGEHKLGDEEYSVKNIESVPVLDANGKPVYDKNGKAEKTYTVTLGYGKDDKGNILYQTELMYGILEEDDDPDDIEWQSSNVFTELDPDTAYFFYICRPASFDESTGKFMKASEVAEAGMVFPIKFVDSLTNGKYAISSAAGDMMYQNGSSLATANLFTQVGEEYVYTGEADDLSAYVWTAESKGNSNWTFKYGNQYLNLSGQANTRLEYGNNQTHRTWTDWGGHKCNKVSCKLDSWSLNVSLGNSMNVTVQPDGNSNYLISKYFTHSKQYNEWKCGNGDNKTATFNTTGYLMLGSNGSVSAVESKSNVKFIKIPQAPKLSEISAPSGNYSLNPTTVTYSPDGISLGISGNPNVAVVYANGQAVSAQEGKYLLNAGTYEIVIQYTEDGNTLYANPGKLTVNKATLNDDLAVTVAADEEDELKINATVSGRHIGSGGYVWFGYKGSDNKWHWFASSDDSTFPFRLRYGSYTFAAQETGSVNYEGVTSDNVTSEIDATYVELVDSDRPHFMYTLDSEGITWYKMPKNLNPERVQEVRYTYKVSRTGKITGITTSLSNDTTTEFKGDEYKDEDLLYRYTYTLLKIEIHVMDTNYSKETQGKPWYEITNRLYYEDVNGHEQSLVRGESLYFMGTDFSINTHGCQVDLYGDLVVLNNDIAYGNYTDEDGNPTYGSVNLHPYTEGATKVLLFTVEDIPNKYGNPLFAAKTLYEIPAGTDIYSLTSLEGIRSCPIDPTTDAERELQYYLVRSGDYPVVNLDIAYASEEQLSRIVSSETMGWTVNGVLNGSSSDVNAEYCIPTYVTSIGGNTSYKANRVLFAAGGTNNSLEVPSRVTFTTRYLSVDAVELSKSGSGSFVLKNLGQDDGLIQKISNLFNITASYSKTLQMDFEHDTILKDGESVVTVSTQICRLNDGQNLFAVDLLEKRQPLTAEYKPSELEDLFENNNGLLGILGRYWKTVKVVDRYIDLIPENPTETTLTLGARLKGTLDLYTNYLYVDPQITTIDLSGGDNDIVINSHESGFTEKEYLGIFKGHSGDSYTGTIVYFKNDITVKYSGGKTVNIAAGFYFVDAVNNGVPLAKFNQKAVPITTDDLKALAVYIDPNTGAVKDSYVDTGLDDNESIGIGGFSGGAVG